MKLSFLPHVREGMLPVGSVATRAQVSVALRLESPGRASGHLANTVSLLGPGDVVGIDPRQVLRVTPSAGTRDAEPEFFPSIEFDAPDLPWTYSPLVPAGTRVLPWIALIVVEMRPDILLVRGLQGQAPWILRLPPDVAARELPDLADSWAWAHAQVACESPAQVADTLANHPDRTLSRLLAPRRLLPFRAYLACVVPAFLAGRIAGLGEDPAASPLLVTGGEPAWSAADRPSELPVYHSWAFRTGEAGDFESLAQRLHAAPMDPTAPPTPLHLSLPSGDSSLIVDWEAPLRARGAIRTRPPRPPAAVTQIREVLAASTGSRRVLGPTYFGAPWVDGRPLTPVAESGPELNLTPMLRAASSLGAEAVRAEQEALVAAAAAQLDEFRARQREGRRRQLAAAVTNRIKLRLAAAPAKESARVFAPLSTVSQRAAANVGMYTAAGRRAIRKEAAVSAMPIPIPPAPAPGPQPPVVAAVVYRPAIERVPVREIPPPVAPVDTTTIPTGEFSPHFARPMSEPLAERFPELMLPGGAAIDPDGVSVVESNPAFVEAFLVGANQELNYELLWRGIPAAARATAFRRFWPHAADAEDIDAIESWDRTTPVGSHVETEVAMVLLVRSELVRRYPSLLVAAVPAAWNTDGSRSPVKDQTKLVMPDFRGRIGADVLYAGFSRPSIPDAIGDRTPAAARPGWFLLLSENPGDPRFGLDPNGGTTPPTRATLGWGHLSPPPDGPYAPVASFPPVLDAAFVPQNATAAGIANLVRQRPFRAYLHASLLVRLES